MAFNPRLSEGVRSHFTHQENDPIKLSTGAPLSFECDKQRNEERVGEDKDGDRRVGLPVLSSTSQHLT